MSAAAYRAMAPWLGLAALLVALPLFFASGTSLTLLASIGVYAVFALSYNMLLGQGGMLSFGHAVYFGVGGFAAIHVMLAVKDDGLPLPIFFVPVVGFIAGLAGGALFGIPARIRAGTAFSMITLGLGELVAAAGFMFSGLTGGEEGLAADRTVGPVFAGLPLGPLRNLYIFVAVWLFVAALAIWAFSRTPLGRLANALRDNPERLAFIGYDPRRLRYLVFVAAAGFAGLAGALAAVDFELMSPLSLGAEPSALVLLMTYVGGVDSFFGPMLGAAVITLMRSLLSDYTTGWQLYVGVMFMGFVLFAPGGIAGLAKRARGLEARAIPAAALGASLRLIAACGAVLLIESLLRWREGVAAPRLAGMQTSLAGLALAGALLLMLAGAPLLRGRSARATAEAA